MAGASRQWQHPHVDVFKTEGRVGDGGWRGSVLVILVGIALHVSLGSSIWLLTGRIFFLCHQSSICFGDHQGAFCPAGLFLRPNSLANDFFGSRSFGTDASSNSPFPASSLVADVRGDVSEDCNHLLDSMSTMSVTLMVVEG